MWGHSTTSVCCWQQWALGSQGPAHSATVPTPTLKPLSLRSLHQSRGRETETRVTGREGDRVHKCKHTCAGETKTSPLLPPPHTHTGQTPNLSGYLSESVCSAPTLPSSGNWDGRNEVDIDDGMGPKANFHPVPIG